MARYKRHKLEGKPDRKEPICFFVLPAQGNSSYVSIYGEAFLLNDSIAKEQYWRKKWEDFCPDRQKDYVLIKVVPELIEVLSFREGLNVDTVNWQPLSITFKQRKNQP